MGRREGRGGYRRIGAAIPAATTTTTTTATRDDEPPSFLLSLSLSPHLPPFRFVLLYVTS